MKKLNVKDCAACLSAADELLLVTHLNPDGDTVGSAAALCSALRRAGKRAFLYPNPQINAKLLPYVERYFAPEGFVPGYTVAVDVSAEHRMAKGFCGSVEMCIDHHPGNTVPAALGLVKSEKSSCGEIVLEVIKKLNGGISKEEADLLYIALSTDTGCFCYSNTNSDSFRAAAVLLDAGADNRRVNTDFFRKVSRPRLALEGLIYSGISYHRGGEIAVATVTKVMLDAAGATEDDLDDLAGLVGRAEGARLNITIREMDGGISKVSLRSGPDVNCCEICGVFGGGGHAMASGCTIMGTPDKAKELLLAVIDEVWK